jgi:HEAT repeat protein
VRAAAAHALAGLDTPLAEDALLRAVDDPEEAVRVAAIRALRERGEPFAVKQLVHVATSSSGPDRAASRQEAVEALASLEDPEVARGAAAEFLAREVGPDDKDQAVLERLVRAGGDEAVRGTIEDLVAQLRESSAAERAGMLLVALAPDSVEPLVNALHDDLAGQNAAVTLGLTHDSRAVEPLCSLLLGDGHPSVRRAAAWALGEIRDPAAIRALLMATGDVDYRVRSEAIASFDSLGNAAIALSVGVLVGLASENGAPPQLAGDRGVLPPAPDRETEAAAPAGAMPILRRLFGR